MTEITTSVFSSLPFARFQEDLAECETFRESLFFQWSMYKIMALLERQPYDAVHHPHIVIRGLLELLFQMIRTRIHAENGPNHFQ